MEGWQLPKVAVAGAEGKAAKKQPMSAREQCFQGGDLGEEEDEEMPGPGTVSRPAGGRLRIGAWIGSRRKLRPTRAGQRV